MKKYISLLIIVFSLSATAQNIIINGTNVNVSQDVSFPYWLDSMATIEIGSQVVSISALEFNIVPTTNGNSLVFSQTKTITSEETVPNGKTWKIEGVLLDSTAVNNSSSSGGGQVIVSGGVGNMAVALSEQSSNSMNMGAAMLYCDSLQESGYDNWAVPTLEEIMYLAGGGGVVPGTRTGDVLWSTTLTSSSGWNANWADPFKFYGFILSNGSLDLSHGSSSGFKVRCVRHESISVSGSGSSSGGSNTPSALGSGMPTMISAESDTIMFFISAMTYCDTLVENGNTDWVMPNFDQLTYAISGGCVIPDGKTVNYLWTRSINNSSNLITIRLEDEATPNFNGTYNSIDYMPPHSFASWAKLKCRCIR